MRLTRFEDRRRGLSRLGIKRGNIQLPLDGPIGRCDAWFQHQGGEHSTLRKGPSVSEGIVRSGRRLPLQTHLILGVHSPDLIAKVPPHRFYPTGDGVVDPDVQ